jgi:hypothetical protein
MELRSYTSSSHMPWHKDEQLYDTPQWECIYTGGAAGRPGWDGAARPAGGLPHVSGAAGRRSA